VSGRRRPSAGRPTGGADASRAVAAAVVAAAVAAVAAKAAVAVVAMVAAATMAAVAVRDHVPWVAEAGPRSLDGHCPPLVRGMSGRWGGRPHSAGSVLHRAEGPLRA